MEATYIVITVLQSFKAWWYLYVPHILTFRNSIFSTESIVTDLSNALPGNSSVNKVQHATIHEVVFSMSSASHPVLLTDQSTRSLTSDTCFLCGLRHAAIEELCFLRCPRRGYITRVREQLRGVQRGFSEFWGSRVTEQDMARRLHIDVKC
jgi:hypothetical protein